MCELSSVRFAVSPNYNSFGDIIQLVECSLCILFFLLAFDELVFG